MDNSQFRTILRNDRNTSAPGATASPPSFKKPALGSRARASIPMTPRSVAGYNASKDFARQVAAHGREQDGQPPTKKFKANAAPKGSKLPSGYQDRTMVRRAGEDGEEAQDDKEKRFKALEEMYKLQQIDEATFENLKREIGIGGNIGSTHLVKGLDWRLLERVRRGEDVHNESTQTMEKRGEAAKVDVEDELDQILDREVQANRSTSRKEQDDSTTNELREEQVVTRDEILRRLKESRAGNRATAAPEPVLGERFKKVTSEKTNKKKFVEVVDGRRREVLVITNKDGTTKRKTRWMDKESVGEGKPNQPLGMEVPAEFLAKQQALLNQQAAEDEDDDIFQGVADYDPLAGINSDSEQSDGEKAENTKKANGTGEKVAMPSGGDKPRNYFPTGNHQADAVDERTQPNLNDPTLLAAFKRAAGLRRSEETGGEGGIDSDPDGEVRRQQLLARLKEQDRADAADLDLGFGESRFGDEDDEEGVLWDDAEGTGKKSGRKRGKKRKGDKDNVSDVMAVLEGRGKKS